MTPFWKNEKPNAIPATVTPFQLEDEENKSVTENNLSSQTSLVNFFFTTCPSICPIMMNRLETFRHHLPSVSVPHIYSVSTDPEHDNPNQLKVYAKAHHLNLKNWSLLTGSTSEVYRVGREIFHADGSLAQEKFIHTTNIYLIDKQRRIRGIYDTGSSTALALLTKDLKLLSQEQVP